MRKMSTRRGFTLPEVLVTVTIVAVLAAVMVPAVINQVGKGDSPSISQDLAAVRTAITTFASDTRHFPKRLSDLTQAAPASTDKDINGLAYGTDAALARGPYLPTDSGAHTLPTGGVLADSFVVVNGYICLRDDTLPAAGGSRVSPAVAALIEKALDPAPNDTTTGRVVYQSLSGKVKAGTLNACLLTK